MDGHMFSYYKLRAEKNHSNLLPEYMYHLEKSQHHMISHNIYQIIFFGIKQEEKLIGNTARLRRIQ